MSDMPAESWLFCNCELSNYEFPNVISLFAILSRN